MTFVTLPVCPVIKDAVLLRRLIWLALVAAVLVGTAHWLLVQWQAAPIIFAAEAMEDRKVSAALNVPSGHAHGHQYGSAASGDSHVHEPWKPADGLERSAWTWMASVLLQFGLALGLLVAIAFASRKESAAAAPMRTSLVLAAAGFFCLFAWPALGLPPEIPGMDAARLGSRQAWWALGAGCAVSAVASAVLLRASWRWVMAVTLLGIPFVVEAPHIASDPFVSFDESTATQLRLLAHRFVWVTVGLSLIQWVLLGLTCGVLAQRWLLPVIVDPAPLRA